MSEEEAKDYLRIGRDEHKKKDVIRQCINDCSRWIERKLDRRVRYRSYNYTEYHTFTDPRPYFHAREFPIISVVTLHESMNRSFDSDSLMVEDTDYLAQKGNDTRGKIWKISSGTAFPSNFDPGVELIKLVYTAGFDGLANVPEDLRIACKRCVGRLYREVDRKLQGVSNMSDKLGNITRFSDKLMPPEVKDMLTPHKRLTYETGRDATEAVLFGSVTGTVTASAVPVASAVVTIAAHDLVTTTNANGVYTFSSNVPVGSVTVQASKSGSGVGTNTDTVAEGASTDIDVAVS